MSALAAERPDASHGELGVRLVLLAVACTIGFAPAVSRLAGRLGTGSSTELAVVVPVFAVVAAMWLLARRPEPAVALPTPAADATVAVWLLALALGASWWLPRAYGFDTARLGLDLVGLPLFAAGATVLLLGGRVAFLVRGAIALAVLASPPLLAVGGGWVERVGIAVGWPAARLTAELVGAGIVERDGLRMLDLGGTLVAVDLACAGASTTLGVLLVVATVAPVLDGGWRRRLLWLGGAAAAALVANALRLAVIVLVGESAGGDVAMRLIHPWAGMAVAAVVAIGALLALRRTGLGLSPVEESAAVRARRSMPPRRTWRFVLLGVASLAMAAVAGAAWQTDPLAARGRGGNVDATTLVDDLAGPGDRVVALSDVDWAPQFYGLGATWERRLVLGSDGSIAAVDVVTAGSDAVFDSYGLVACYATHGVVLEQVSGDVGLTERTGVWLRYGEPDRAEHTRLLSWRATLADGRAQRVVVSALADPDDPDATRLADDTVLTLGAELASATAPSAVAAAP